MDFRSPATKTAILRMFSISAFLTFLLALIVLEITPGPDMMLVLGVASLLKAYPASLMILQWAGAGYLFYLGAKMILANVADSGEKRPAHTDISDWSAIREGTINSLTNPKSLLFMFAFLPQFVDPTAGPIWLQLIVLGTIQKLAGILSLGSVALASGTVGQWLHRWPRLLAWQQRFTGVVMLGLGVRLLMSAGSSAAPARG